MTGLTTADRAEALRCLTRGRYKLGERHPHFAFASWKLKLVEDETIPTLYTNGQIIAYNPKYVLGCSDDSYPCHTYAISALTHETLHALLGHCKDWAAKGYDRQLVNIAQDHAINLILRHDLKMPVHKDWVCDDRFKGMTWFAIYDILLAEKKANPQQQQAVSTCKVDAQPAPSGGEGEGAGEGKEDDKDGDGKPNCPGIPPCDGQPGHDKGNCPCPCHPAQGAGPGGNGDKYNDWDKIAVEAARFAQSFGHGQLPGFLEELVERITKPVVNWKTVIERWASRQKKGEYSFRRLNKRYMHTGLAMPSLHSYTADLITAWDTSGSTYGFRQRFGGELFGVLKACGVPTTVIQNDTSPKVFKLKKAEDILNMPYTGGGGTNFCPVFDLIAKGGWEDEKGAFHRVVKPEALIFFTDGMGTYPAKAPPYKVLWCIPNAESLRGGPYYPPFGTVLSLPAEK